MEALLANAEEGEVRRNRTPRAKKRVEKSSTGSSCRAGQNRLSCTDTDCQELNMQKRA